MKKVLIVDDVNGWIDYHSKILTEIFEGDVEIITANFATQAYDILLQEESLDIIFTDLQMENDYEPKFAGEWLVEQIKTLKKYDNTRVVISSASFNVRQIAETLGVLAIPKSTALKCISAYKELVL